MWALGHPAEIGSGGLPFTSFVFLNEIIGRSEYAQWAVRSVSMQDSIMLLGQRGEGFTIAEKRLGPGRIFHCMRWLGQAQRASS